MPVWGGGVLTLPVSKKCKNEKKKRKERKKKKKKKETKNANCIGTMFDRNFHFVSRTEGENYARFALTRLCLAGGSLSLPRRIGSVPAKTLQASE